MLVGQAIKSQEIWQDTKIDNSILDVIYNELKLEFCKEIVMINKTKEKLILIGMPGSGKLQLVNF